VDVVVVVGVAASGIAEGARTGAGEVIVTAGRDEATAWVRQNAGAEDVVLVKASRGAALEVVAEAILMSGTEETTA
jgi:UDP-N-acetylmuramoyl-tripeptide--D-alanyl-D-alanine ligase